MHTMAPWLIVLAMAGLPAIAAAQSTTLQMPGQPPVQLNQPFPQPMQPQVQPFLSQTQQFPGQVQPTPHQPQLWQPNQELLQQSAQQRTFQQEWQIGGPGSTGWPSGMDSPVYQTWPQTGWPQGTPSQRFGAPTGWPENPPSQRLPRTGWPNSSWTQPQPQINGQ